MTLEQIRNRRKEIRKILKNDKKTNLDELENELRRLEKEEEALNIDLGIEEARSLGTVEEYLNGKQKKNKSKSCALRCGQKYVDLIDVNKEDRNLSLAKYIRGIVTGDWKGAEDEKRAITTTATGTLIPQVLSAQIIDLARDQSLFTLANVPIIPMDSNNVTISKLKKDPIFKFKKEGEEAEESSMELESVTLKSKTAYGYAYVSLEAIKSSKNLQDVITNAFSQALAQTIDKAMLYGQYNGSSNDEFAPGGIINNENINEIIATEGEGYDSFIKAIGKVRGGNGEAKVSAINSKTEEILSLLKDSNGQYLTPPQSITNLKQIVSNQLNSDENGNDALVFDPEAMIIGIQDGLQFEMFRNTDECIKKGLVGFRIYQMIDCIVTQPNRITKIKNIK